MSVKEAYQQSYRLVRLLQQSIVLNDGISAQDIRQELDQFHYPVLAAAYRSFRAAQAGDFIGAVYQRWCENRSVWTGVKRCPECGRWTESEREYCSEACRTFAYFRARRQQTAEVG